MQHKPTNQKQRILHTWRSPAIPVTKIRVRGGQRRPVRVTKRVNWVRASEEL
jgi:hypothetical protein